MLLSIKIICASFFNYVSQQHFIKIKAAFRPCILRDAGAVNVKMAGKLAKQIKREGQGTFFSPRLFFRDDGSRNVLIRIP